MVVLNPKQNKEKVGRLLLSYYRNVTPVSRAAPAQLRASLQTGPIHKNLFNQRHLVILT